MSDKMKIYKNPERKGADTYKPYVPQYEVEGVTPSIYKSTVAPGSQMIAGPSGLPLDNPRVKRPSLRQPYAETTQSPIGRGRGPVPNVGNNMEHTWSSVDGEIIDDLEVSDQNHEMIDNNEFVTNAALGYQNGLTVNEINSNFIPQKVIIEEDNQNYQEEKSFIKSSDDTDDLHSIIHGLSDDNYLLIVSGTPLCSGPKDLIEEQAKTLVFGEHEMCAGNPVPIDDIIIVKRIKVKVGLFLE